MNSWQLAAEKIRTKTLPQIARDIISEIEWDERNYCMVVYQSFAHMSRVWSQVIKTS